MTTSFHPFRRTLILLVAIGLLLPTLATAQSDSANFDLASWQSELSTWRAEHAREISAPDGWLTLAGLEWLKPGVNAVGSDPASFIHLPASGPAHLGLITVSNKTLQLLAPVGGFPEGLTIDGKPAREGVLQTAPHSSVIVWKNLTLLVLERGSRYAIRIKDSQSPALAAFHGLNWFDANPALRVEARWTPYLPPHIEKIPTIIGTVLEEPAPGFAEFTLNGKLVRLEPILEDPKGKTLFFILRDETSKSTTYQAARFLYTGFPDHGLSQPGTLVIDFNRLQNPPCAYTPYATCPLPPEQNRLSVAIEAGEKRYDH